MNHLKHIHGLIKLDRTGSTNDYAVKLLSKEEVLDDTIIWALEQTKGKGEGDSKWESEAGTTPSVENLIKIAIALDVPFEWLATGRGPMALSAGIYEGPTEHQAERMLTSEEKGLLKSYQAISPHEQKAIHTLLDGLAKQTIRK